jgi:hypothetical protein
MVRDMPKYVVTGHQDAQRVLELVRNAPIPHVVSDPIVKFFSKNMAPLPDDLVEEFEKSVRDAGHTVNQESAEKATDAAATQTNLP